MLIKNAKVAAAAALITAASVSVSLAAGHGVPGTAGEPNCHGQTAAWANEVADLFNGVNGLGNLAKALGVSVKELQAAIDELCTV